METLGERIKDALASSGKSQAGLAAACGVSAPSVSDWVSGKTKSMKARTAIRAAEYLGVSLTWLTEGRGKKQPERLSPSSDRQSGMPVAKSPQLIDLTEHPDLVPIKRVRFKLAAGVHGYAIEVDNGDSAPVFFRRDWMERNGYRAERLAAFRVCGASMEPSLWDDDLVVVNLDDTQPSDGDVFAVSYEGEPGVKRLRRDGGEWWLVSDNADQRRFAPKRCHEDTQILGRVIYKQSERI